MAQKIQVKQFMKPSTTPNKPVSIDTHRSFKAGKTLVRLRVGYMEGSSNLTELTPPEAAQVAVGLIQAAERALKSN